MGNDLAKLKNDNRRTKTSIQRMKSFHHARKLRGARDQSEGPDQARKDNHSNNLSKCESERKLIFGGAGPDCSF